MRIRTLALTAALALPGLAYAAPSPAPPPTAAPPPKTPGADAQKPDPAKEKAEMAAAEKKLMDSFKGQDNFQVQGKLLGADSQNGSILLQREDMPMALLIVPDSAKVNVNGKKSTLAELQPGADVRATFNLAQQYPIALEVNASQTKDMKKTTEPATPKSGEPPTAPPSPATPKQ